jgi:hypothetical protein
MTQEPEQPSDEEDEELLGSLELDELELGFELELELECGFELELELELLMCHLAGIETNSTQGHHTTQTS